MSTLLEIEEAIATLPPHEIAELSRWLDDFQAGTGDGVLAAQLAVARQRMRALDEGRTTEIPGELAHREVREFISRRA